MLTDIRPVCKRCLLSEIDPDGLYKKVSELIEAMPEEKKAPPREYSRRIGICQRCESLKNGICAECGCFIELRAAGLNSYCPSAEHKW